MAEWGPKASDATCCVALGPARPYQEHMQYKDMCRDMGEKKLKAQIKNKRKDISLSLHGRYILWNQRLISASHPDQY